MTRTRVLRCLRCGTTDGVHPFYLCDPCADQRLAAELEAQGLPFKITDPAVLERLVRIIGHYADECAAEPGLDGPSRNAPGDTR